MPASAKKKSKCTARGSAAIELSDHASQRTRALRPALQLDEFRREHDRRDPVEAANAEADATEAKKKKRKEALAGVGGPRGIETLFRTSYQAQLDMIALAATKSNIMISLNGVLISVVLLSAAYLINFLPLLAVPIASLLVTCTLAIVFAVLAARPTTQRDRRSLDAADRDEGMLLIFEDFGRLPADRYVDAMMRMLADHPRVYKNMAAHIHDMGCTADRKFNKLAISYGAFMVGLVVSVLLLLAVVAQRLLLAA